jgi:flagellar biosynthesis protein FlhF
MELKRIIARDSRSANEKAIQLYGPDVLIISSQRVDQQTELIVAVEVASEPVMALPAEPLHQPDDQALNGAEVGLFKADIEPSLAFSEVFHNANAQALPVRESAELKEEDFQTAQAGLMSRGMASPSQDVPRAQPLAVMPTALADPVVAQALHYEQQRSHEIVDMLRQEMAALRKEFALSRQMQPWQQTLGLSEDIQKLTMAMQEVGMPVALRSLLTDSIQEMETLDEAWPVIERLLVDAISQPTLAMPETGVHVLCGPSGSGKTSMLGRLAYAAAQSHGAEKQVMISFGDQRPGAWSQIQLLASQAGASCFRAADSTMLQTLLDELHGKTIWIDTPGNDFAAHAQQMLQAHSGVKLHAVLPVDATVTSVQKILQNSDIRWSSLMLTKVDEAAYPWPLIKGLCDQSLPVSCMAEDSKINVPAFAFGAERLVALAIQPLQALLPEIKQFSVAAKSVKAVRSPRAKKQLASVPEVLTKSRAVKPRAVTAKSSAKAVHG